MQTRDLIVVGASAGGVEALPTLVAGPPPDPHGSPSALPSVLARAGKLPARVAVDGDQLTRGVIQCPPAGRHLLVCDGRVCLTCGPRENGHRPAVDALFRSAARHVGPRAVAVILSGARDDGAAGLRAVVNGGGVAVVQDPEDAPNPSMPLSAMESGAVDHVVSAYAMGPLPAHLAGQPVGHAPGRADPLLSTGTRIAAMQRSSEDPVPGRLPGLACPTCHGALFEIQDGPSRRYRCRVGHAWSPDTLWMALRALEEKAALAERLAGAASDRDNSALAARYRTAKVEAERAATRIRQLLDDVIAASVPLADPAEPAP